MASLIRSAQFVALDSRNHILQPEEPAWDVLWAAVHAFLADDEVTAPAGTGQAFADLTRRERELLELIARGCGNAAIAEQLGISPKTVRNHVSRIFDKVGAAHRSQAIVMARQAGFGRDVPGLLS